MEYLRSGWLCKLSTSIDFTASNGEPREPNSLHQINTDGRLNNYEEAILAVGKVLENYDYNQMFPVFGFGGIPRFTGATKVSHCFNLNGQPSPEVYGIEGIFQTYKMAI